MWADELLAYSVNLLSANSSTLSFLDKWYTRVISVLGTDGKIPIKKSAQRHDGSIGRLVGLLAGCLVVCLAQWSMVWLSDFVDWLTDWLLTLLVDRLIFEFVG